MKAIRKVVEGHYDWYRDIMTCVGLIIIVPVRGQTQCVLNRDDCISPKSHYDFGDGGKISILAIMQISILAMMRKSKHRHEFDFHSGPTKRSSGQERKIHDGEIANSDQCPKNVQRKRNFGRDFLIHQAHFQARADRFR